MMHLINKSILFFLFLILNSYANDKSILDKVISTNELKVCVWPQYYGISYVDPRTQNIEGIDSDLAVELAKDLNVNLKFVKSSFPSLIEDIKTNKCDIAMYAIGKTEQRIKQIRFTSAHLQSDIYAITTTSNKKIKSWNDIDKKGVVVAVAKETYHETVMKERLQNASLVVIQGFKQREEEVQAGRADVFMTDYPYAKKMLAQTQWARVVKPEKVYYLSEYAWAVAYGDDKFYNRVEIFIRKIKKDGRLLSIAKKHGLEPILKLK